ncbi:MAG: hypothetical protein RR441_11935, partial [Longicatena sp.]
EKNMAMYVFRDKDRKEKLYAKSAASESRNTRFFCPNENCDAHMYVCGLDGTAAAYFSANRKGYRHIKGCPFGASNSFNSDDFDEALFDFDSVLDGLSTPSKKVNKKSEPGEHGTGESIKRPPRTIRQIYDMCKSIDVVDTYDGKDVGQMIVDDRSEFMYPKGVFGKRIIEGKVFGYFYNSKTMEITIKAPILSEKYTFQVKIPDKELFAHVKKTIFNNRDKIIVVSGEWRAGSSYDCFATEMKSKKQFTVI